MHLGKEVYGENELMEVSLVGLPANPAAVRAWENFGLDLTNTPTGIPIVPEVLIRSGADAVKHELPAPISKSS